MDGTYVLLGLVIAIVGFFILVLEKRWKKLIEEVKTDQSSQAMWLSTQNQIEQLRAQMGDGLNKNISLLTEQQRAVETIGDTWVQFKAQYYIFALIFLIFDIETVFLYPWAAAFDALPLFAVLEGLLFVLILVAGLVYAWRKGALKWA